MLARNAYNSSNQATSVFPLIFVVASLIGPIMAVFTVLEAPRKIITL